MMEISGLAFASPVKTKQNSIQIFLKEAVFNISRIALNPGQLTRAGLRAN
ncbi:MAG: hypothetical protein PHW13_01955 [Methylococcales bacterium]|nr:hypothetical protein [Methylococcales bacterium]